MSAKSQQLSVGIDLGTSQSAIATSADARHVVDSYVGWPVDMVARKVVKKSVLIGQEALENRSLLDLHRPLEQGLIKEGSEKDIAAVKEILGYLIGVATEGNKEQKVRAVVGAPLRATRVSAIEVRKKAPASTAVVRVRILAAPRPVISPPPPPPPMPSAPPSERCNRTVATIATTIIR